MVIALYLHKNMSTSISQECILERTIQYFDRTINRKDENMATITLVQAAQHTAQGIHLMTAMPMAVDLQDLAGGAIQFTCSNMPNQIHGSSYVKITYDAGHGSGHEEIGVSSVLQ